MPSPSSQAQTRPQTTASIQANSLIPLCLFSGITALLGGMALVLSPDGSWFRMPLTLLQHTPFHSFLYPGLLLAGLGALHLIAGLLAWQATKRRLLIAGTAGIGMVIWIVTEVVMIRGVHWLHALYLGVGLWTIWAAAGKWRQVPWCQPIRKA